MQKITTFLTYDHQAERTLLLARAAECGATT